MKKALVSVLAILLAVAMLGMFAACNNDPETPTEPDTTTELEITTTEPDTIDANASTSEEPTSEGATSEAPTTLDGQTTVAGQTTLAGQTTVEGTTVVADAFAPPANLNTLSKAEQLAYFNKVANRVRADKPGFKQDNLQKIDKISLSGAAGVANPIVEMVKNQLMPGEWKYETISKGSGNNGKFLSENSNASDLKASDITSITSVKQGENWVITVKVISETNPAKGTGSANSRINCIASRQAVLSSITDISGAISADVNNATLKYHSGYATLTVNAKGQVIASESGFQVDAQANSVKISIITTNVNAPQSTVVKCHSFTW